MENFGFVWQKKVRRPGGKPQTPGNLRQLALFRQKVTELILRSGPKGRVPKDPALDLKRGK